MLDHAKLTSRFGEERSLPDGVVDGVTIDEWERFLRALVESGWPLEIDGQPVDKIDAASLLPGSPNAHTLKAWPGKDLQINVFPLSASSIDFDFASDELRDQRAVNALAAFIELTAAAVQKDVVVSHEGQETKPLFVFDFQSRRFRFADRERG